MGKRRKAREIVLQALYEAEFSDKPWEDIFADQIDRRAPSEDTTEHARELFFKTMENLSDLDNKIESSLENWDMDRVALVDKNILRFGLAEVLYFDEIPSKVIINEAIEVAHRYSSADAGRFINGLLDRFVKEFRRKNV
ncbi:MAG: transcription antitermination factor NusB [Candidatus Krumholzibacteria bacterium]|nr:transcription antitermination factor NusB [Candidatus Krumholzibacteria bacterium]